MEIILFWILITGFHLLMTSLGYKLDKTKAYCGVAAYVSNKPANIDKLKILGIYNTTRGTDSCGVAINNKVKKGVDKIANFSNFIENEDLNTYTEHSNYTILIHARNASNKLTKDNPDCAHPFEIKNKKGTTILIGMHNGFVSNEDEICKKYKVKEEKVDSKTLLSIIAKSKYDSKALNVLNDYEGTAVLVWYFVDEPNTLYIWKGAGRKYVNGDELEDERPLFVYRPKDENGKFTDEYYLSSIKESLLAIGGELGWDENDVDKEPTVSSVEPNRIIKITPGEKLKITIKDRVKTVKANNDSGYTNHTPFKSTVNSAVPVRHIKKPSDQLENKAKMLAAFKNYPVTKINQNPKKATTGSLLIDNEPFIHDFYLSGPKVYFYKGRYWINGHLVGGTIRDNYVELELDIDGYPKGHRNCDDKELDKYYFFQGLLLLSKEKADLLKAKLDNNEVWSFDKKTLVLTDIQEYIYGFVQNFGDKARMARMNNDKYAIGVFYPMFDYNRQYHFMTGGFEYSEYKIDPVQKSKTISAFLNPEKPAPAKVMSPRFIPLDQVSSATPITEGESTFSKEEEVFDNCYDTLTSMRAAIKKLVLEKDTKKYESLLRTFRGSYSILKKKIDEMEPKKENAEEETTFTDEKGLLYS